MKILSYIFVLIFFVPFMHAMELTNGALITIEDSQRQSFQLSKKEVKALMPHIYQGYKQWSKETDEHISFYDDSSEESIKKHITQHVIQEMRQVYVSSIYIPEPEHINTLCEAAVYLDTAGIVLKRLAYHAQYKIPFVDQYPEIKPVCMYNLAEMMEEEFFDWSQHIRKVSERNYTLDNYLAGECESEDYLVNLRENARRDWMLSPYHADAKKINICIDLSNLKLSSLKGLKKVPEKYDFDPNTIRQFILNNNCLRKLNIRKILEEFPNVRCILARYNPIKQVICDPKIVPPNTVLDQCFKLNLSGTNLKGLPHLSGGRIVVKLKNTPLSLRARYEARYDHVKRHMCLGIGLSALMFYALHIASGTLFHMVQSNELDLEKICVPNPTGSFLLLLFSSNYALSILQPSKRVWGPKFKITDKNQPRLALAKEYGEDAAVIAWDVLLYPYRALRNYCKK